MRLRSRSITASAPAPARRTLADRSHPVRLLPRPDRTARRHELTHHETNTHLLSRSRCQKASNVSTPTLIRCSDKFKMKVGRPHAGEVDKNGWALQSPPPSITSSWTTNAWQLSLWLTWLPPSWYGRSPMHARPPHSGGKRSVHWNHRHDGHRQSVFHETQHEGCSTCHA